MPCRDDGPTEATVSLDSYNTLSAQERATQKRCDLATRVACEIEALLTPAQLGALTREAQTWIKKHREADALEKKREEDRIKRQKEDDARREREQQLRLAALKKLTREERNALGLPHPA